jgi:hypothetical protein
MSKINREIITAQSMGASFNSDPVYVGGAPGFSIQAVTSSSSSPVGTFKLQASNDLQTGSVTNYTDIPDSDIAVSGDAVDMWDVMDHQYKWVRVVYTRTSGTATVSARINMNELYP